MTSEYSERSQVWRSRANVICLRQATPTHFGYLRVWECDRTLGILEAGVTAASPETDCLAAISLGD